MQALQEALLRAARAAQRIDTRPYEVAPCQQLRDELVPKVGASMVEAMAALTCVLSCYDAKPVIQGADDSGVFESCFDALLDPEPNPEPDACPTLELVEAGAPTQRVADASFMARWELDRKRTKLLAARERDDLPTLLAECCSSKRRVLRATSGVEQVLSELEGQPSVFEGLYRSERQLAVATRAAYLGFGSDVRRATLGDVPVERGVRLAGIGIARLAGRDLYEDLRVEDRLELRALQRRLLEWLRGPCDEQAGRHLLSDVSAFASLLMEVSRRPALVEHDLELLQRLQAELLLSTPEGAELPTALSALRGRDPELDMLIANNVPLRVETWLPTVERVLAELAQRDRAAPDDDAEPSALGWSS